MPPKSRGNGVPSGFQSKSTPNLPILRPLDAPELPQPRNTPFLSPSTTTSPQSPLPSASPSDETGIKDNLQDEAQQPFGLAVSDESDSDTLDSPPPTARPLYTSRSQTHLPPHTASTLFPPFYNRPPTPLPPSPSLTSLLRPSFSTTTSRPTTPDSSDAELHSEAARATNGTSTPTSTTTNLASITKSARDAPTVPRASPKVPSYEYYGFALYLGSSAAFLMYILWAYLPSPLLHQLGIHYYPDRWWALAVPAWLVMLIIYIYVALASYNTRYLTLPLSSCENLVDECGQVAIIDRRTGKIARNQEVGTVKAHANSKGGSATRSTSNSLSAYQFASSEDVDWKKLWSIGTDGVLDVPIGGVCEVLYGADQDSEG